MEIRVERPFILFALCDVVYDGRAKSTLVQGNYVIVHKGDGTIFIHGGSGFNPLNYQSSGAVLRKDGNVLISKKKNETITITIASILSYSELDNWSENEIDITRTELDLKNQIVRNIVSLTEDRKIIKTIPEFKTPYGPIDIVAITDNNLYHVIEVKRGKASLGGCAQLERYLKYFSEVNVKTKGWLMSPDISKGAMSYCVGHGICWRKVVFEL